MRFAKGTGDTDHGHIALIYVDPIKTYCMLYIHLTVQTLLPFARFCIVLLLFSPQMWKSKFDLQFVSKNVAH